MSRLTVRHNCLNLSPISDTHYIQFWPHIYFAPKCRLKIPILVSYKYWPSILALHSSNRVSMHWLQTPADTPCSTSTLVWSLWPYHYQQKLTPQTGHMNTVRTGFQNCQPFTLFVPNQTRLTCSNLFPLAPFWGFMTHDISRKACQTVLL